MTERELADLLRGNPDLVVDDDLNYSKNSSSCFVPSSPKLTEHELQAAIIKKCDERSILRVEYGLILAIPNGGARHPAVAGKLKAEGVRAGVPDLLIPVARRGYHGLWLELKVTPNKPSQAQLDWIRKLKAEGYRVVTVWDSVEAAMLEIESYLEG